MAMMADFGRTFGHHRRIAASPFLLTLV